MAEWLVILKSGKTLQFRSDLDMHEKETFASGSRIDVELLLGGKYVQANIQVNWSESAFLARIDGEIPFTDTRRSLAKQVMDSLGRGEAAAAAEAALPITHVSCSICWPRYQKDLKVEAVEVDAPLDHCCFCGMDLDVDAGVHSHFVAPANQVNCVGAHPVKERGDA